MKLERNVKKFFDGLSEGVIYARKCKECGAIEFPPHYACNACGYHDTEWTTVSGRGVLKSVITPVALNANNTLAAIGPYCFGEVELEEGCSFNSTIFGVDAKNAKKIRGKLPVPVHPKFIQMDGYTTLMFEVDEEALADKFPLQAAARCPQATAAPPRFPTQACPCRAYQRRNK